MINVSEKLVFLTEGQALKDGINEAIRITRQRLFDIYSEGKIVHADDISSTSKRTPNTHTLAFCKFFDGKDIFRQDLALDAESFLNQCYELTSEARQGRNLDQLFFKGIIPNFDAARKNLSVTFSHEVKRGVLMMLFVLWKNRHILLTTNFTMPTWKSSKNTSPMSMCEPFYSEVIAFFQSFRRQAVPGTAKLIPSEGLTHSIQNTIQSYAWRVVVATDWHKVEDVQLEDCVKFLDYLQATKREIGTRIAFPINHMVKLLEHRTKRLSFTSENLATARKDHSTPLGKPATLWEFHSKTIKQSPICEPISGKEIYANHPEWIDSQVSYIASLRKKNKETKGLEASLATLNEYLFAVIPASGKKNGDADIPPPHPSEFDRRYFNDNSSHPTLRDHIENITRSDATVVRKLSHIDRYFNYLQQIDALNKVEKPFVNPIMREIDFPIVPKSNGTTKNIVSQLFKPALMSYLYAIEGLFEYVFNKLREGDTDLTNLFRLYSQNANSMVSTEKLGYCPFIYFRGACIPIAEVKLDLFVAQEMSIDNGYFLRLPAWSHLIQALVCLETGIRTLHIEWLDIRTYDKEIDRNAPLEELAKLYVPTDKVRKEPWIATVSKRVIELLDKQRNILKEVNQTWAGIPIWYDKHEGSIFGEIVPAFPSIALSSTGLPSRTTYEKVFKRAFYSFQEFANKYELYSKKIEWVKFIESLGEYKSIITPHSCRATIISAAIHYLPPEIIGSHITGHTSTSSVEHYVVADEHVLNEMEAYQASSLQGIESLALLNSNAPAFRTDDTNSALHKAIVKDKDKAMSDFSAVCFEVENKDGEMESGLTLLKLVDVTQVAHHSTHMCPANNVCPIEVVEKIGPRNCGQCWLAIKTVDHIPRIDAHIRSLYAELKEDVDLVNEMIANKASKCVVEENELDNMRKAAEITAWSVSLNVLEENRKNAATKDKFLVGRPEIVEKYVVRMATEDNPMTNLLLRVRDAINYPEYLTPQLKASMTKARNMLLIKTRQFERLLSEPKGYDQVDEFRGIIRGVLETTNLNLDQLHELMTSEVPQVRNRIPMLEIA